MRKIYLSFFILVLILNGLYAKSLEKISNMVLTAMILQTAASDAYCSDPKAINNKYQPQCASSHAFCSEGNNKFKSTCRFSEEFCSVGNNKFSEATCRISESYCKVGNNYIEDPSCAASHKYCSTGNNYKKATCRFSEAACGKGNAKHESSDCIYSEAYCSVGNRKYNDSCKFGSFEAKKIIEDGQSINSVIDASPKPEPEKPGAQSAGDRGSIMPSLKPLIQCVKTLDKLNIITTLPPMKNITVIPQKKSLCILTNDTAYSLNLPSPYAISQRGAKEYLLSYKLGSNETIYAKYVEDGVDPRKSSITYLEDIETKDLKQYAFQTLKELPDPLLSSNLISQIEFNFSVYPLYPKLACEPEKAKSKKSRKPKFQKTIKELKSCLGIHPKLDEVIQRELEKLRKCK